MEKKSSQVLSNSLKVETFDEIIINDDIEDMLLEQHIPQPVIIDPPESVIPLDHVQSTSFHGQPGLRKIYKRAYGTTKVKTVGKIRQQFETEQIENLPGKLKDTEEVFSNYWKSNKDKDRYRSVIEALFKQGNPLTRASWKYFSNINLYKYPNTTQYINTDGQFICLSGSLGGDISEFKYDPAPVPKYSPNSSSFAKPANLSTIPLTSEKKGKKRGILARTDLKFKPGPLCKKPTLHKNGNQSGGEGELGPVELVRVPSLALEVFPQRGRPLPAAVRLQLDRVRPDGGRVDAAWAHFATSLVGLQPHDPNVTSAPHLFILPYVNNQTRILMQKDLEFTQHFESPSKISNLIPIEDFNLQSDLENIEKVTINDDITLTIKTMLIEMIDAVTIGELQDRIFKYDDDYNPGEDELVDQASKTNTKKCTKRKYWELMRLDVTVIDLEESSGEACELEACKRGCVCASLRTSLKLNEHCGLPTCMLQCSCSFEKPSYNGKSEDSSEISKSAVANFQHHMNRYLSREEKKFKRTVICSNDKTIVMGACRRGLRVPKKFQDFCTSDIEIEQEKCPKNIQIVLTRLPELNNIFPWCMTHQLYRCFCKGLFTEGVQFNYSYLQPKPLLGWNPATDAARVKVVKDKNTTVSQVTSKLSSSSLNTTNVFNTLAISGSATSQEDEDLMNGSCSRSILHTKYICRGRKRANKYAERNYRIRWNEKANEAHVKLLREHIRNAHEVYLIDKTVLKANRAKVNLEEKQKEELEIPLKSILSDKKNTERTPEDVNNLHTTVPSRIIPNSTFVYNWKKLISDYKVQKIYIWVTLHSPLKIFVTVTPNIYSKTICFPISYHKPIPSHILDLHSPMLREIVELDVEAHNNVILFGRIIAWELVGSVVQKKLSEPANNTIENNKTVMNVSTDINNLFAWPKIPKSHGVLSTSPSSSFNITQNTTLSKISDKVLEKPKELGTPVLPICNEDEIKVNHIYKANAVVEDNLKIHNTTISTDSSDIPSIDTSTIQPNGLTEKVKDNTIMIPPTANTKQENRSILKPRPIPTLKVSSSKLIRLPPTVKGPIIVEPKYRWLLLHIEDDFSVLSVATKNFTVTYNEVMKAMLIAETSGKTCRFPVGSLQQGTIPTFGIYAVPGNGQKEVFLGPYKFEEPTGIKTLLKGKNPSVKKTWGNWTKALNKPHVIVCNRNSSSANSSSDNADNSKKQMTKVVIGVSQKIIQARSNRIVTSITNNIPKTVNVAKESTEATKVQPSPDRTTDPIPHSPILSTIKVLQSSVEPEDAVQSPTITQEDTEQMSAEESDDDVIFLPTNTEVVEISDSEQEDEPEPEIISKQEISCKPENEPVSELRLENESQLNHVWFVCTNIPCIGYITATENTFGHYSLKYSDCEPIECSNTEIAIASINLFFRGCFTFSPKSLVLKWKLVKDPNDIMNLKPFDEKKLEKPHTITKSGYKLHDAPKTK